MDEAVERRIAANEAILREVNEAIERGMWQGEQDSSSAFRCECTRLHCNALLPLSSRDYERVRAHPRRFVLARGHEDVAVESVVETHSGFVVVEKRGEAGRLAEVSDPRR